MGAYIHVFGHLFFAVSDEAGSFAIADVPAGRYTVKAWHEVAGVESTDIMVPEDGEIKLDFEFGKRPLR
jgi:hypothetical protein